MSAPQYQSLMVPLAPNVAHTAVPSPVLMFIGSHPEGFIYFPSLWGFFVLFAFIIIIIISLKSSDINLLIGLLADHPEFINNSGRTST